MDIDQFRLITKVHRLVLRPHRMTDASFMIKLNSDPEVTRYTPDGPLPNEKVAQSIIESLRNQFQEKRMGRFIVEEPTTGNQIGWCGLKWLEETKEVDLGYRFLRNSWGKGFATDSALRCLEYGLDELFIKRITAKVLPENTASITVLKKIGMRKIDSIMEDGIEYEYFEICRDV